MPIATMVIAALALQVSPQMVGHTPSPKKVWVDLTAGTKYAPIFLNIETVKGSGTKRTANVIWHNQGFLPQVLEANCATRQFRLRDYDTQATHEVSVWAPMTPRARRICTKDFKGLRHLDEQDMDDPAYDRQP